MGPTRRFPISIKGVLLRDASVCLLRNERDEWELPGGRVEVGEAPTDCLAREFREEVALEVVAGRHLGCWWYEPIPGRNVFIVAYACAELAAGSMSVVRVSSEHIEVGWFGARDLGGLRLPDCYRSAVAAALGL